MPLASTTTRPSRSRNWSAPRRRDDEINAPHEHADVRPHRAKRGEGERLREEILDATEHLLIDKGDADQVSMRLVAEAIGRTPPSIYLHFATKDELIHAVCERQFDAMTDRFRGVVDGVTDPVERIRRMARAYVEFALDHPEQYRILFMNPARTGVDVEHLDDLNLTQCFGMLHQAVADAIDQARFVKADSGLVALSLWAAVHGVSSLLIAHQLPWPPLDELLDQLVEQNLRGLGR
jgi:AcrR family transcriptional regulator